MDSALFNALSGTNSDTFIDNLFIVLFHVFQ